MLSASAPTSSGPDVRPLRLGVVNYLNTLPLIDGLEKLEGLELVTDVPANLVGRLLSRDVDMALCSSIDFQRSDVELLLVPAGILGCSGETMTVRLFSRVPLAEAKLLHADIESHTSVVLARILLREICGADPQTIDYERSRDCGRDVHATGANVETMLLIGDKAVSQAPSPSEFPHQMDLGEAWFAHTGLPFVFATWMVRADAPADVTPRIRTLAAVLDHQRRHNRERLPRILVRHGSAHGAWPRGAAARYLASLLRFEFGEREAQSLALFYSKAAEHRLVPRCRPLRFLEI